MFSRSDDNTVSHTSIIDAVSKATGNPINGGLCFGATYAYLLNTLTGNEEKFDQALKAGYDTQYRDVYELIYKLQIGELKNQYLGIGDAARHYLGEEEARKIGFYWNHNYTEAFSSGNSREDFIENMQNSLQKVFKKCVKFSMENPALPGKIIFSFMVFPFHFDLHKTIRGINQTHSFAVQYDANAIGKEWKFIEVNSIKINCAYLGNFWAEFSIGCEEALIERIAVIISSVYENLMSPENGNFLSVILKSISFRMDNDSPQKSVMAIEEYSRRIADSPDPISENPFIDDKPEVPCDAIISNNVNDHTDTENIADYFPISQLEYPQNEEGNFLDTLSPQWNEAVTNPGQGEFDRIDQMICQSPDPMSQETIPLTAFPDYEFILHQITLDAWKQRAADAERRGATSDEWQALILDADIEMDRLASTQFIELRSSWGTYRFAAMEYYDTAYKREEQMRMTGNADRGYSPALFLPPPLSENDEMEIDLVLTP